MHDILLCAIYFYMIHLSLTMNFPHLERRECEPRSSCEQLVEPKLKPMNIWPQIPWFNFYFLVIWPLPAKHIRTSFINLYLYHGMWTLWIKRPRSSEARVWGKKNSPLYKLELCSIMLVAQFRSVIIKKNNCAGLELESTICHENTNFDTFVP